MRATLPVVALAVFGVACSNNPAPEPVAGTPQTDQDKALYALGAVVAQNVVTFDLTAEELKMVQAGFADAASGKELPLEPTDYFPQLNELQSSRVAASAAANKQAGQEYIAKAAAAEGATQTDSGIVITTLTEGSGASPTATDTVRVHYHGTLIDGKVFDSSIERQQPAEFPLGGVIPCWTEAVQTMKVGGKARVVCPSDLAYGDASPSPTIKAGSTLIFEVELLDIVKE